MMLGGQGPHHASLTSMNSIKSSMSERSNSVDVDEMAEYMSAMSGTSEEMDPSDLEFDPDQMNRRPLTMAESLGLPAPSLAPH